MQYAGNGVKELGTWSSIWLLAFVSASLRFLNRNKNWNNCWVKDLWKGLALRKEVYGHFKSVNECG